jgi:putative heme iron utilization protein
MIDRKDALRPTDEEAIRLARTLLRSARFGAIAVLDPQTGSPLASRVGVATDIDGTPIILVSMLSLHTRALLADPRCSLLLGEPGKGDALAHPRLTLVCTATVLETGGADHERARRRYLARNPKASLYAGLGDFRLLRLGVQRASLNGGFGKAFDLTATEIVPVLAANAELATAEASAVAHMNEDHLDAIELYAHQLAGAAGRGWRLSGIDAEGVDMIAGDRTARVWFPRPLATAAEMRTVLVELAKEARQIASSNANIANTGLEGT